MTGQYATHTVYVICDRYGHTPTSVTTIGWTVRPPELLEAVRQNLGYEVTPTPGWGAEIEHHDELYDQDSTTGVRARPHLRCPTCGLDATLRDQQQLDRVVSTILAGAESTGSASHVERVSATEWRVRLKLVVDVLAHMPQRESPPAAALRPQQLRRSIDRR